MAPPGYYSCGCCGNLFKSDGSEDHLHDLFLAEDYSDVSEESSDTC